MTFCVILWTPPRNFSEVLVVVLVVVSKLSLVVVSKLNNLVNRLEANTKKIE